MQDIFKALLASEFMHRHLTVASHSSSSEDREKYSRLADERLHDVARHRGYRLVPLEEAEPEADKQEVEKEAA